MKRVLILTILAGLLISPLSSMSVKIKNLGAFEGVRENQLIGYGVVVGLEGTGDTTQNQFTFQTIANYLDKMGITMAPSAFQMRNTAAVVITATLPPFPRIGNKIDITVSSLGSAKSLQGGILMITPLRAPDSKVYAVAQGPLSIGGFNASQGAAGVRKNHSTVGRIPNGGIIEREIEFNFVNQRSFTLNLNKDDFTTTTRVVETINKHFGQIAAASDSRTIKIMIPQKYVSNKVKMISLLENLTVTPDSKAKIVINERTGTIVFGEEVKISKIALAHGNITVKVNTDFAVSQPNPLSEGGQTEVVPQDTVEVDEQDARFSVIENTPTIGDVVKSLNDLGATPRDIIAILQAMKSSGSLQADLEII